MHSSLIIQTSFIGDVILTTPLIEELSQRGPVDVVTTKVGASILKSDPRIRNLHVYDKRGRDSGISGLLRFSRNVRNQLQNESTTAYLAQGSLRSAALAFLAGCQERIGFDTSGGKALYTQKVVYNPQLHHSQRLLELAGAHNPSDKPALYPEQNDTDAVDVLLAITGSFGAIAAGSLVATSAESSVATNAEPSVATNVGSSVAATADSLDATSTDSSTTTSATPAPQRLLALAPGSVWATKRWPFYPALASLIAERNKNSDINDAYTIVLIGGKEDKMLGEEIESEVARVNSSVNDLSKKTQVINAIGRLSLLGSAELIRRCEIIVTNDSSPQHLASATNTRTFTIFGPTVPEFGFGPLADDSRTLGNVGLNCRPCDKHGPQKCPLKHWKCMRDLSPEYVARAIFNEGI